MTLMPMMPLLPLLPPLLLLPPLILLPPLLRLPLLPLELQAPLPAPPLLTLMARLAIIPLRMAGASGSSAPCFRRASGRARDLRQTRLHPFERSSTLRTPTFLSRGLQGEWESKKVRPLRNEVVSPGCCASPSAAAAAATTTSAGSAGASTLGSENARAHKA